jgi:hypothetical protein
MGKIAIVLIFLLLVIGFLVTVSMMSRRRKKQNVTLSPMEAASASALTGSLVSSQVSYLMEKYGSVSTEQFSENASEKFFSVLREARVIAGMNEGKRFPEDVGSDLQALLGHYIPSTIEFALRSENPKLDASLSESLTLALNRLDETRQRLVYLDKQRNDDADQESESSVSEE